MMRQEGISPSRFLEYGYRSRPRIIGADQEPALEHCSGGLFPFSGPFVGSQDFGLTGYTLHTNNRQTRSGEPDGLCYLRPEPEFDARLKAGVRNGKTGTPAAHHPHRLDSARRRRSHRSSAASHTRRAASRRPRVLKTSTRTERPCPLLVVDRRNVRRRQWRPAP